MKDAQWLPLDKESLNEDANINKKVYSEVTSGNWYKRTYNRMLVKHRRNHTIYPPLLVAIVLGQDGTLCDKLEEYHLNLYFYLWPIYYIKNKKITLHGFVWVSFLHIQKPSWSLKKIVTESQQRNYLMNSIITQLSLFLKNLFKFKRAMVLK